MATGNQWKGQLPGQARQTSDKVVSEDWSGQEVREVAGMRERALFWSPPASVGCLQKGWNGHGCMLKGFMIAFPAWRKQYAAFKTAQASIFFPLQKEDDHGPKSFFPLQRKEDCNPGSGLKAAFVVACLTGLPFPSGQQRIAPSPPMMPLLSCLIGCQKAWHQPGQWSAYFSWTWSNSYWKALQRVLLKTLKVLTEGSR